MTNKNFTRRGLGRAAAGAALIGAPLPLRFASAQTAPANLKVGLILPMSGAQALIGQMCKHGADIANDIFTDIIGMPTIWLPHSYRGCSQHAPNEHLPTALARDALRLMAGLYWDLGEPGTPPVAHR